MKKSEEKLRKIIREEIQKELLKENDDIENIKQKVHKLWEEFSVFYTRKAEKHFQDVATDLDAMQISWDKSGELKEQWLEMKYQMTDLIERINRYKSFLEETMNSKERADIDSYEDGYYRVDKGGDYYAT